VRDRVAAPAVAPGLAAGGDLSLDTAP